VLSAPPKAVRTLSGRVEGTNRYLVAVQAAHSVDDNRIDDMNLGLDPFAVCRLPLGAYQFATFVNLPNTELLEPEFSPPIYRVTVRSAEEGFVVREAALLLDVQEMDKLIVALQAAAHPTADTMVPLEMLMRNQEYGEFRR
jgi:hypothetical protein